MFLINDSYVLKKGEDAWFPLAFARKTVSASTPFKILVLGFFCQPQAHSLTQFLCCFLDEINGDGCFRKGLRHKH